MIVITEDSAYKICCIQYNIYYDHFECLNECEYSKVNINSKRGNNCVEQCSSKQLFNLNSYNICIDNCNEDYYIKKENGNEKECWLCKDYNINYKYKLINVEECLKDKPQNSDYVNENLFILKCKEGYDLFENGNCIDKCSENFFESNKICQKCDDSCLACDITKNNCTKCKSDEYLDKISSIHTCNKCSEKCDTCSGGEEDGIDNCLTCKQNSIYKFLFNKSCAENCPNGTYPNETNVCITKEKENENKKEDKDKNDEDKDKVDKVKTNDKIMLSIFIVITGFLLLLIIFCFCKNYCYKLKKRNIVEEIQNELIDKKEMF